MADFDDLRNITPPTQPYIQSNGEPETFFYQYLRELDKRVRDLSALAESQEILIDTLETRVNTLENP